MVFDCLENLMLKRVAPGGVPAIVGDDLRSSQDEQHEGGSFARPASSGGVGNLDHFWRGSGIAVEKEVGPFQSALSVDDFR